MIIMIVHWFFYTTIWVWPPSNNVRGKNPPRYWWKEGKEGSLRPVALQGCTRGFWCNSLNNGEKNSQTRCSSAMDACFIRRSQYRLGPLPPKISVSTYISIFLSFIFNKTFRLCITTPISGLNDICVLKDALALYRTGHTLYNDTFCASPLSGKVHQETPSYVGEVSLKFCKPFHSPYIDI